MRGLALLVLVGFGALAPAPPAGAHAVLQTSDPARGSAVARPPEAIVMAFTEEPELALTTVRVLDVAGRAYEAAPARAVPGQASVVRVPVKTLPQGSYTVSWRVISRVDGHLTAGAFSFGVGTSPLKALAAEEGASASPPPALFEVAARLLLLVGLSALLGAAWVGASAFSMLPSGVVRFMAVALVASALGLAALAEAQRAAAGVSLSRLATTFVGRALVWRGAGILLAGSGLVASAVTKQRMRGYAPAVVAARTSTRIASTRVSTKRMRGYAPAVVAAGAAAAMLAHVAAGHAGAGRSFRLASVAVQWMHFLAVGVWIGGLAALLIGVRGTSGSDRGRAVRRFSFVAGIALAVVAATGVIRAVQGIGSWSRLPSTSYGRLVLLKAGLLGLLAVLGAINRYRHVPRADTSLRGLRRVSTAELSVATVILGAAALLAAVSPPASAPAAAAEAPILLSAADFGTTLRARLEVSPGTAGLNAFALRLLDYDTRRPLAAERVTIGFDFLDDPAVGESRLDLEPSGPGIFKGLGGNLGIDGRWRVTGIVQRGADSIQVSFELATRCGPRGAAAPGQPTIFTIPLPGGRSAQAFLDPARPGLNEAHVTFFDASGTELTILGEPQIRGSRAGGDPIALEVRRFSAGHFVGDARLGRGRWRFDVAAQAGEETLRACFEEAVGQ